MAEPVQESKPQLKPFDPASIAGYVGGFLLFKLLGWIFLWPLIFGLLSALLASKILVGPRGVFTVAFSVIGGTVGSSFIAFAIMLLAPQYRSILAPLSIDFLSALISWLVLVAGLVWLALRPGKGAAIVLILYCGFNTLGNGINFAELLSRPPSSEITNLLKAVGTRVALDLLAVTALIYALINLRKSHTLELSSRRH